MQIVDILKAAQQQNSSDIHIVPGNPVMLRIDGKLVPQGNQVLTNVETDNLLSPIVPQELKDVLKEKGELDFAFSVEGFSRVRANVFRQRGSYAAAEYALPEALVLCNGNVSVDGKVVYMPIYMLMFLEKEQAVNVTYKLDLSDL